MSRIGIIGAGAWGTALGIVLARFGHDVALWGRDAEALVTDRRNTRYLPGIDFPGTLHPVGHVAALGGTAALLLVVPAQAMRETLRMAAHHLDLSMPLVLCAKGIERDTGLTMAEIAAQEAPQTTVSVLSGPSFATEMGAGYPAAITLASPLAETAQALAALLSGPSLRVYATTDVTGVELAGALKNVIAIACGMVIGAGLGENARAALMTRGLAEMGRLIAARGGCPDTLLGLAGIGDLALTSFSPQSRNFTLGRQFGQGQGIAAFSGRLVEGVDTAEGALALGRSCGVALPIAAAVHAILAGRITIAEAMADLMTRPLRMEM